MLCAIILFFIIALSLTYRWWYHSHDESDSIAAITDEWCTTVTTKTPDDLLQMFCKKSILLGTVSQTIRDTPETIRQYFNYFMNIPGLDILDRTYHITKINPTTYVNNAYITWTYTGREPFVARMTFVYEYSRGHWCLFLLHSSVLPDRVDALKLNDV